MPWATWGAWALINLMEASASFPRVPASIFSSAEDFRQGEDYLFWVDSP